MPGCFKKACRWVVGEKSRRGLSRDSPSKILDLKEQKFAGSLVSTKPLLILQHFFVYDISVTLSNNNLLN